MIRTDHTKVLRYIKANPDLQRFFSFYLNNCITLTNPYHNANHTMAMMYHICCIYEESNRGKYEFVIDEQGLYILLLSAMFHDYNHSAGKFADTVNVSIAIESVESLIMKSFPNDTNTAEKLKNIVHDTIKATCYPYVIEDKDLNLYQRIIRECDILVAFSDDFFTQTIIGLKTEMQTKDWTEFLANESKFLLNSWNELKLEYSHNIIEENHEDLLNIIDCLVDVLK